MQIIIMIMNNNDNNNDNNDINDNKSKIVEIEKTTITEKRYKINEIGKND